MQTTEMYTLADPSIKFEALDAVTAPKLRSGRFRASDKLIIDQRRRGLVVGNCGCVTREVQ
jgi:integrase/recombinase XerD